MKVFCLRRTRKERTPIKRTIHGVFHPLDRVIVIMLMIILIMKILSSTED